MASSFLSSWHQLVPIILLIVLVLNLTPLYPYHFPVWLSRLPTKCHTPEDYYNLHTQHHENLKSKKECLISNSTGKFLHRHVAGLWILITGTLLLAHRLSISLHCGLIIKHNPNQFLDSCECMWPTRVGSDVPPWLLVIGI